MRSLEKRVKELEEKVATLSRIIGQRADGGGWNDDEVWKWLSARLPRSVHELMEEAASVGIGRCRLRAVGRRYGVMMGTAWQPVWRLEAVENTGKSKAKRVL